MIGFIHALLHFFCVLLTEDADNKVWCPLRIFFFAAFVAFLALSIFAVVVLHQAFDTAAFAGGASALLTSAGVAIYLNGRSDPPKEKS